MEGVPRSLSASACSSASHRSPSRSSASFCLRCSSSRSTCAGLGPEVLSASRSAVSLSRPRSRTCRSCSLCCCCRMYRNTSSFEDVWLRKKRGEARGSGEAREDGDQGRFGLFLRGWVEDPEALCGALSCRDRGSEHLGLGRCLSPARVLGPPSRLGPVLRRANWTCAESCPSRARCCRGQSSASSCCSLSSSLMTRR